MPITSTIVVCPSCRVPFTRTGAARSSGFYRTHEENDTCIVCREGLDPSTLERRAEDRTMNEPNTITDLELVEALEMLAPALRLARVEELRKIADRAATLVIEAAERLRDRANVPEAPGMIGKIRNVQIGADGKLTADLEVHDAGREFLRQATKGGRS